MTERIGFMQGRLSPIVDGKIQSFPWGVWKEEFARGKNIGLSMMEWTLDQEMLYQNPLMLSSGQREIIEICKEYRFLIPSLTGDCFMQAPFWKAEGDLREKLKSDFIAISDACSKVGIKSIVIPLVDNGSLENIEQENILVNFLNERETMLKSLKIEVLFESDFQPAELERFISRLGKESFGINYDIGNSAALGFDPSEEFAAIGNRIRNIHVKDRLLAGTTVPLSDGHADFNAVFSLLDAYGYKGNYILQTARATSQEKHAFVLQKYKSMVEIWVGRYGS